MDHQPLPMQSFNRHSNVDFGPMLLEPALGDPSLFVAASNGKHDDVRQRQNDITVKRPVLTQQAFDQLHEPSAKSKKSLVSYVQSLAGNVTCTKKQLKKQALKLVPCIDMVRNYDVKSWLAVDLVCGLTIGIICIPQSMGYALLAGVPPVYGLYSSFLPVFLYCIFATSRHMCFGTLAITSLLVGNVVARVSSQIVGSAQSGSTTSTSTPIGASINEFLPYIMLIKL